MLQWRRSFDGNTKFIFYLSGFVSYSQLMELVELYNKTAWQQALQSKGFKKKLSIGLVIQGIILFCFPLFFQYIEKRNGFAINDFVLNHLPAVNLSIPIFTLIWMVFILFVIRSTRDPQLFITFLYSFIIVSLMRFITISLVRLNPPSHLIPLIDPVSNMFYGGGFVTKDLFFSGHTATLWLFFLSFRRRFDKYLALFSSVAVGFMVLMQHVHYTYDVVAAPIFATICYVIAKKIVNWTPNHKIGQEEIN